MPAIHHVHTYVRLSRDRKTYHCIDPHCYHVLPRDRLIGKASICTHCGSEFNLTARQLELAKPRCLNCSGRREAREFRNAKGAMSNVLKSLDSVLTDVGE